MDKDMPPEKRQMMLIGLGGATFLAVAFLIWMVSAQLQRQQLVQDALPSKPIAGFGQGAAPGNPPPGGGGGALPGAPPTNAGLPGAPPMPR